MPIIEVENLSKRFTLAHESPQRYQAMRDIISDRMKSLFTFSSSAQKSTTEEFWALNDVSFKIEAGDRLGIIGRNGAGKSTLLKILSRITPPTKGKISIRGRVASLLEVGTGFHPELSGRENIYLNGAILGMSRIEIQKKFEEIVDFAEVEKFLDTPVKRYSSGMYVKLAFAVAAHLEPEILIVDEVLSVGDTHFQKKCLKKMNEVSKDGRTILFVSHNMVAIQNTCSSILVLNKGEVEFIGDKAKGLIIYEKLNKNIIKNITSNKGETLIDFKYYSKDLLNPLNLNSNDSIRFEVEIQAKKNFGKSWVNICIDDPEGHTVGHMRNDWYDQYLSIEEGITKITIDLEDISLSPGVYTIWARVVLSEEMLIFDSEPFFIEVNGHHLFGKIAYKTKWVITKK